MSRRALGAPGRSGAFLSRGKAVLKKKKTLWPESASELYRQSYRRLSAKLVPAFSDREKFNDFIGTRTRDLTACSIMPQPTTLSRPHKAAVGCC
jgi:hypothetical protein